MFPEFVGIEALRDGLHGQIVIVATLGKEGRVVHTLYNPVDLTAMEKEAESAGFTSRPGSHDFS